MERCAGPCGTLPKRLKRTTLSRNAADAVAIAPDRSSLRLRLQMHGLCQCGYAHRLTDCKRLKTKNIGCGGQRFGRYPETPQCLAAANVSRAL
jgi:hypothetical protein